jgi:hypothetical protein
MLSDTDLPHQPDIIQQSPPMKENKSHKWKRFFIALAVINIMAVAPFISPLEMGLFSLSIHLLNPTGFFDLTPIALIQILAWFFPVAVVDFASVLVYRIKNHPHGKSLFATYVALFITSLLLLFGGIAVFTWFWLLSFLK